MKRKTRDEEEKSGAALPLTSKRPNMRWLLRPSQKGRGRGERWQICPSLVGIVVGTNRRRTAAGLLFTSAEGF